MTKSEQLSFEIQCVLGQRTKPKKLRYRVLALETVAHFKVSKGGKLPVTRLKQ